MLSYPYTWPTMGFTGMVCGGIPVEHYKSYRHIRRHVDFSNLHVPVITQVMCLFAMHGVICY